MVAPVGLAFFKEAFKDFEDQYVLIGGTATQLAMENAGLIFSRTTKDLDIVVMVDALTPQFIEHFWRFVKAGNYQNKQKSSGTKQFYRFTNPVAAGYPVMLELFSRRPDFLREGDIEDLTAIPLSEEIASLSAILLDDDYYGLIQRGKNEGVIWVDAPILIPLKAKAWLDLSQRKLAGEKVDSDEVRKHLRDVLRLLLTLPTSFKYSLPESISADIRQFIEQSKDDPVDVSMLGHSGGTTLMELLTQIEQVFL